jgi:hypothetical protein
VEGSPGLILSYASSRALYRLVYHFTATHYFTHNEADSYAHRFDVGGFFVTSPTTDLHLSANVTQGQTNAFGRSESAAVTQVEALPPGGISYVQLGLVEGFGEELSPVVHGAQGLAFTMYLPYGDDVFAARTYEITSTLGVERAWVRDALGLELRDTYTQVEPFADAAGVEQPRRRQILNALVGRWRRDYGRYFASQIDLGVLEVMRAEDGGGRLWQPTGVAAMRYVRDEGQAELVYTHGAQLNPYLGQVFLTDEIALRGAVPLGQGTGVTLSGANGFEQGRAIDEDGRLGDPVNVLVADVALSWSPSAGVVASARYQRLQQLGDLDAEVPIPEIVRNTFLLTIGVTYPPDNPRLPIYRPAVRVDRSDAIGPPPEHSAPPQRSAP